MEIKEVLNRYVIATFDNPTTYLCRYKNRYVFVENLAVATKTMDRETANDLKEYFYHDTGLRDIELVILPLKIEYKLIDESNNY